MRFAFVALAALLVACGVERKPPLNVFEGCEGPAVGPRLGVESARSVMRYVACIRGEAPLDPAPGATFHDYRSEALASHWTQSLGPVDTTRVRRDRLIGLDHTATFDRIDHGDLRTVAETLADGDFHVWGGRGYGAIAMGAAAALRRRSTDVDAWLDGAPTTDARLARRAVFRSEARIYWYLYNDYDTGRPPLSDLADDQAIARRNLGDAYGLTYASARPVVDGTVRFGEFGAVVGALDAWNTDREAGLQARFEDPPASTAELLGVTPPVVSRPAPPLPGERVQEDTLGAYLVLSLLAYAQAPQPLNEVVWGGDQLYLVRDGDDLGVVWWVRLMRKSGADGLAKLLTQWPHASVQTQEADGAFDVTIVSAETAALHDALSEAIAQWEDPS
ncbi:MAG: hypothetical protein RMA76_19610 [Deltaproteobacteria bacterium]|jgi:hypothetical protein